MLRAVGAWLAILAIGLTVVLVHELGHLVAAWIFDVGIARIRVGVGPVLRTWRLGRARISLGLLPVAVLVDLLGRDPSDPVPPADASRALRSRPVWVRAVVLMAGPACNLALPAVLWFGHFIGQTAVPPPVVGTVVDDSAAATAGIEPGDRIVSIDGDDVRSFDELIRRIEAAPERELRVHLVRGGEHLERFVLPRKAVVRTGLGEPAIVGRLGVLPHFYAPQIGVTDPEGPAARAGLRTGDILTSIDGEPLDTVEDLERWLPRLSRRSQVRLTYLRPVARRDALATWVYFESHHAQLLAAASAFGDTGMAPANTFVRRVQPNSPAAAAGLVPGDRIVEVDGRPFTRWEFLEAYLAAAGTRPVTLAVERPGRAPRTVVVQQRIAATKDARGIVRRSLLFGAVPYGRTFRPPPEPLRGRFAYAVASSVEASRRLLADVAVAAVTLPFRAATVTDATPLRGAASTARRLFADADVEVLRLASIVTIVAGLVHLLPLPILDGGRLLFDVLDTVRRKRSSTMLRFRIGIAALLVTLLVLALVWARTSPSP
ncbi:MAG: PDZ domain-containing protein [Deltaproteobacteria bacterium]|nr:MAG: PDZ domain-containing protein [Deltaproteobacteria bacterium]